MAHEIQGHSPSPLESAIPIDTGSDKQRYKNDEYLNKIRIIYEDNPKDEESSCFYTSASMMLFRMVNSDSVKYLRKKCLQLVNYNRLITAHEPELTMERFATVSTLNMEKELPEEMVTRWQSVEGAPRVFSYLLSYIVNKPIYLLDLSTNQWREYDMSNTNLEQSQFHSDLTKECLGFFNPIGPPFMLAEHLEMKNDKPIRTHVAAMMHEYFDDNCLCTISFKEYVEFMSLPEVRKEYNFIFSQ